VAAVTEYYEMKQISLKELEAKAQALTKKELEAYAIPEEVRNELAMTTLFEGEDRVFVLYVPAPLREDARVIARTRMNSRTGEGSVEFVGLSLRQ
jgi:hypothetical protein